MTQVHLRYCWPSQPWQLHRKHQTFGLTHCVTFDAAAFHLLQSLSSMLMFCLLLSILRFLRCCGDFIPKDTSVNCRDQMLFHRHHPYSLPIRCLYVQAAAERMPVWQTSGRFHISLVGSSRLNPLSRLVHRRFTA